MSFLNNIIFSPVDYSASDVIARECANDILDRLDLMKVSPNMILDMGCGPAKLTNQLQLRYTNAKVVGLDVSEKMLMFAKEKQPETLCICADSTRTPFKNQTMDMVIANLILPWQENANELLKECKRILQPNGLLMITAFGPDTLREWHHQLTNENIPQLLDMHNLGDLLLQQGFADPVLDVNYYTLAYDTHEHLVSELYATGMLQPKFQLAPTSQPLKVTYEVVQAHAWIPASFQEDEGITKIPLASFRRQVNIAN